MHGYRLAPIAPGPPAAPPLVVPPGGFDGGAPLPRRRGLLRPGVDRSGITMDGDAYHRFLDTLPDIQPHQIPVALARELVPDPRVLEQIGYQAPKPISEFARGQDDPTADAWRGRTAVLSVVPLADGGGGS